MYEISFTHPILKKKTSHTGVLVRDDTARDKLQQKLKNSIIMLGPTSNPAGAIHLTHTHRTLYESKGLEFNDVSVTPFEFF